MATRNPARWLSVLPVVGHLVHYNGTRGVTLCRIASVVWDAVSNRYKLTLTVERHTSNAGSVYDAGDTIHTTDVWVIPYHMLKRDRIHIRPYVWAAPAKAEG